MDDFVIARNPEEGSTLPFLLRVPLGRDGVVLKTRDTWPRTSKMYCHRAEWPADPDIVERTPVRSCTRRGAAIDLVLDRGREARSQFVFTMARGREMIFWQTARVAKQARPNVRMPTARAAGRRVSVLVDTHERYPWRFADQQATTERRALEVGDYAVEADGAVVAAVERKSLEDLVTSLTTGRLRYQLAELATVPRAAVVVEDRWSRVFALEFVAPSIVAEGLAELQVRVPTVPVVFAETRKLAQEWTYRFFGAALEHHEHDTGTVRRLLDLSPAGPLAAAEPTARDIRSWAQEQGLAISDRGRIPADIRAAFDRTHR